MYGTQWEDRRREWRLAVDADQVEAQAAAYGSAVVDFGLHDERLAGDVAEGQPPPDAQNRTAWSESDATMEALGSGIGAEIRRRHRILGPAYPFTLEGATLRYAQSSTLVYEFCLATSLHPDKRGKSFLTMSQAFELLTCLVLQAQLGSDSRWYRLGLAQCDEADRPARFRQAIEELYRLFGTGEWCWNPIEGFPQDPEPRNVKDLGMDTVNWTTFDDGRGGSLVLIGNCACGQNIETKLDDTALDFIKAHWIRPLTIPDPQRVLSTSHHIPNAGHISELASKAGLVFDRARLTLIAESTPERQESILKQREYDYVDLIRFVIEDYEAA